MWKELLALQLNVELNRFSGFPRDNIVELARKVFAREGEVLGEDYLT